MVTLIAALEQFAETTESHIECVGGQIALKPGVSKAPSFVQGSFRFVVSEVNSRLDAGTGKATYDVNIALMWEPQLLTYRLDQIPKIDKASDNLQNNLTFPAEGGRTFTTHNSANLVLRPRGLSRAAASLSLEGSVRVTLADELLLFDLGTAEKIENPPRQQGVGVLAKTGVSGADWFVDVSLSYPKSEVIWESFELYWMRGNVLRLLPPNGASLVPDEIDYGDTALRYVFKNRAKQIGAGSKLDYRTPAPMREVTVPFRLEKIGLP